jgi:hypothetical protein
MKHEKKARGDASLFTPGVDRRDFLQRIGSASAVAAVTVGAMQADARVATNTQAGRVMLEQMTHETFAAHVGAKFEVKIGGATVPFELIEATTLTAGAARPKTLARREPFSLVFRAPRGFNGPQQIYVVSHESIGTHGIFLVPIGPDEHGPRYEAIFN